MTALGGGVDPMVRFRAKVTEGTEVRPGLGRCEIWTGAKDKDGYGLFQLSSRRTVRAHRWIYDVTSDEPLGRRMARHSCDTPGCVNPGHIVPGTNKDNMRDMVERQRDGRRRGAAHHAAKMTQALVDEMLSRRAQGESLYAIHGEYGISYSQAKAIASGRKWKPLTPEA